MVHPSNRISIVRAAIMLSPCIFPNTTSQKLHILHTYNSVENLDRMFNCPVVRTSQIRATVMLLFLLAKLQCQKTGRYSEAWFPWWISDESGAIHVNADPGSPFWNQIVGSNHAWGTVCLHLPVLFRVGEGPMKVWHYSRGVLPLISRLIIKHLEQTTPKECKLMGCNSIY